MSGFLCRVVVFFGALLAAGAASAAVLFADGFESPPHTAGQPPSNGWLSTMGVISRTTFHAGTLSFESVTHPTLQQYVNGVHTFSAPTGRFLTISAWGKTSAGGTVLIHGQFNQAGPIRIVQCGFLSSTGQWLMQVMDGSNNVLFSQTGALTGFDSTVWNKLELLQDRFLGTATFRLNGTTKFTLNNFTSLVSGDAWVVGVRGNTLGSPSTSKVNFDDVEVSSNSIVETLRPASWSVTEGYDSQGDLASLFDSDDNRLTFFNNEVTLGTRVEITSEPTFNVGSHDIRVECEHSAARNGLLVRLYLKNNASGLFDLFYGNTAPTTDTSTMIQASDPKYIGNGRVVLAVAWAPINDEAPAFDGWEHLLDRVSYVVAP